MWEHRKPGYASQTKTCQKEVSGQVQWDMPQSQPGVCLRSPRSLTRRESSTQILLLLGGELLKTLVFLGPCMLSSPHSQTLGQNPECGLLADGTPPLPEEVFRCTDMYRNPSLFLDKFKTPIQPEQDLFPLFLPPYSSAAEVNPRRHWDSTV